MMTNFFIRSVYAAVLFIGLNGNQALADKVSEWVEIGEGARFIESSHVGQRSGQTFRLSAVTVDVAKFNFRVLDAERVMNSVQKSYSDYSLRELADVTRPFAIINGGFTASYSYPIPVGLVIQDGQRSARLNTVAKTQSGIFCVSDKGVNIVSRKEFRLDTCAQALQSGPRVVDYPSKNGIRSHNASQVFERSVVCVDDGQTVSFIVTSKVSLFDLGYVLAQSREAIGFGCSVGLNLSGAIEAGMIVNFESFSKEIGSVRSLLPSAIAIVRAVNE